MIVEIYLAEQQWTFIHLLFMYTSYTFPDFNFTYRKKRMQYVESSFF